MTLTLAMLVLLSLVGIFLNDLQTPTDANSLVRDKVVQLMPFYKDCTVDNTTYSHGRTFRLDCKTQCVCENGRHACSSLCPKEQLPAPGDTSSCRSPRLVDMPGQCCKMWLCGNPTADVAATCSNSSTSPWTPCNRHCDLGLSTRTTNRTLGCHRLSKVRLCENRACSQDTVEKKKSSSLTKKLTLKFNLRQSEVITDRSKPINKNVMQKQEHRTRKGHECRHMQRLSPARIRLGPCVSKKLYRPKLCGRCQHLNKCCVPSVSTTIEVELLCPLGANDPINFVDQRHGHHQRLWDTVSVHQIDQELLQSHKIEANSKFISVEWILKCVCGRDERCKNIYYSGNSSKNDSRTNNYGSTPRPKLHVQRRTDLSAKSSKI